MDVKPQHFSSNNDTPKDNKPAQLLVDLFNEYQKERLPIHFNFRKKIDWMSYGERATHMIHLYPAKLLPHIPAFFLSNDLLSSRGDLVLDPFSGSGTVALEALLSGRQAAAADSNPLARLITKVKTTPIPPKSLFDAYSELKLDIQEHQSINRKPKVVNIEYWYRERTIKQLGTIVASIESIVDIDIRNFFLVCFSNTVKKVSWSDPKLSVPVKLRRDKYEISSKHYDGNIKQYKKIESADAFIEFFKIVEANIKRMGLFVNALDTPSQIVSVYDDARELKLENKRIRDECVKLIITSPPYAGAQKYIRASSLNLGWLGYCENNTLRDYEKQNIGREHFNKAHYDQFIPTGIPEADKFLSEIYSIYPLRASIASTYLIEMRDALKEMYRVLRSDGTLVLVTAANQICSHQFETNKYLILIAESIGFRVDLALVDDIHSRGLMTKRNKTAGIINSEWVYVLRKHGCVC